MIDRLLPHKVCAPWAYYQDTGEPRVWWVQWHWGRLCWGLKLTANP